MNALKTYSHLQHHKRKPNEYEITSSNLLYYLKNGFEINVPLKKWYDQYQTQSLLKCQNWENFYDPRETTYTRYTSLQKEQEIFIDGIFQSIKNSNYDQTLSQSWIYALSKILPVLRYPWHGLQMIASYIGQMAPSGRIVMTCLFQAADEMRCIQRMAYRMRQIQYLYPEFGMDSKSIWEQNPAWQPLREVIEQLLVTYDWSEALIALNLVLKPMLNSLFMIHFANVAKIAGDYLFKEIYLSLNADYLWHRQWSDAFIQMVISDTAGNKDIIMNYITKWYHLVLRAVTAISDLIENLFNYDEAKAIHVKLQHDYQAFLNNHQLEINLFTCK